MKNQILCLLLATFALSAHARGHRDGTSAPIWGPFLAHLHQCAPGCVPYNFNVYRPDRRSCHSQGRAIDVGGLNCGGKIHQALAGGIYTQFVSCMSERMVVLYHNGKSLTAGHRNHAHFSIGCSVPGHPNHW